MQNSKNTSVIIIHAQCLVSYSISFIDGNMYWWKKYTRLFRTRNILTLGKTNSKYSILCIDGNMCQWKKILVNAELEILQVLYRRDYKEKVNSTIMMIAFDLYQNVNT